MGAAAIPIAIALTAAATTSQVVESKKQRKEAKKEIDRQRGEVERQEQKLNENNRNQAAKVDSVKTRQRAIARQQSVRGDSRGRGGTILTGGQGVAAKIGEGNEGSKTLLGL